MQKLLFLIKKSYFVYQMPCLAISTCANIVVEVK